MTDRWAEAGDVLVHRAGGIPIEVTVSGHALVGFLFLVVGPVGLIAAALFWAFAALLLCGSVEREEFDRRNGVIRQRGGFGIKWTIALEPFSRIEVVRGRSSLNNPQVRIELCRREPVPKGTDPRYRVQVFPFANDADEEVAKKQADILARFLDLPVRFALQDED